MNNIFIKSVLPNVFAARKDISGDVWNNNLTLEKGKTYLIEANSGTGKSSLLSFIYGYRSDFSGQILFDDSDIKSFSKKQWTLCRNSNIALMWQDLRLFPELSAIENVNIKNNLTHFQKKKNINQWFDKLGITDKINEKVGKMSFGQQQRVALIRTLCQPFDFIFLDEPVSHLDESNANTMAEIVREEADRQGAAIIVTSIGKRLEINYDSILKL